MTSVKSCLIKALCREFCCIAEFCSIRQGNFVQLKCVLPYAGPYILKVPKYPKLQGFRVVIGSFEMPACIFSFGVCVCLS